MPQTRKDLLEKLGRNPASPTDISWQWKYAQPGPYVTQLNPQQEAQFQQWVQANKVPFDPSLTSDYDMRGFWHGLQTGDPAATTCINPNDRQLHFSDKWKTPFHRSFSGESKYATPNAPRWNQYDQLVDQRGNVVFDERAYVRQQQFEQRRPAALRPQEQRERQR